MSNGSDRQTNFPSVEGRLSALESSVDGLRMVFEQAIKEWSRERSEIHEDIKELTRSRSTNWGWILTAAALSVTVILAIGNGFIAPLTRDVESIRVFFDRTSEVVYKDIRALESRVDRMNEIFQEQQIRNAEARGAHRAMGFTD